MYSDEGRNSRQGTNRSTGGNTPSRRNSEYSTSPQRRRYEDEDSPAYSSELGQRIRKRNKKAKRRERRRKFFVSVVVMLSVILIISCGIISGMYFAVKTEIHDMNFEGLSTSNSSKIVYETSSGEVIEYEDISKTNNSKWVNYEDISDYVKKATIAIEDKRFYKHGGIDIGRTISATVKYAMSKFGVGDSSYGGSTITQQTIKNITKENDKTSSRKIKEILRAIALEKELSKNDILTVYLNIVYYSNGCNGIETASQFYFNKSASDLSLAEAASIAGITQYPSYYDPKVHPENTVKKRNIILKEMLSQKMITQEEYDSAINTELVVSNKKPKSAQISSFFSEQVVKDVANDLIEKKGYSKDYAYQQIYNGGYTIYSTIDVRIQNIIDKVYSNTANFPNSGVQSAMVIMDPYTGQIKGMAGCVGEKKENLSLNRATSDPRQPGSSIKPLSAYAPAIELKKIDAGTVLKDESITIGNDDWEPHNSYSGFKGNMLPKEAIGRSANIPAVKVIDKIGINKSFSFLQDKFRLSTLTSDDINYSSLALGGLTKGVTVKDMTAAYCVFPNKGKYIEPHTYTKVVDSSGQIIIEYKENGTQIISPSTAYIMSDFLNAPVTAAYGTATNANLGTMPTYGKTGTTDDNVDKWFVGYTPYYVSAVWYGYADRRQMQVSGNPAVSVWYKIMSEVHSNLSAKNLPKPSNVEQAYVCTLSGKLAKSGCHGEYVYFAKNKAPTKYCSSHYDLDDSDGSYNKKNDSDDGEENTPKSSPKPSQNSSGESSNSESPKSTPASTEKKQNQSPGEDIPQEPQSPGDSQSHTTNYYSTETE